MDIGLQKRVIDAIEKNLAVMPVDFVWTLNHHDTGKATAEFALLAEKRKHFELRESEHVGKYVPDALRYGEWNRVVAAFAADGTPVTLAKPLTIENLREGEWDDNIKSVLVEEVVEGSVMADLERISEMPEAMAEFIVDTFEALGYENADRDGLWYSDVDLAVTDDQNSWSRFHGDAEEIDLDACEKVDGRMYYSGAVDEFWTFEDEWLKERFGELDPDGECTIFHRKGKDWYVGPTSKMREEYLACFEEEEPTEEEMSFLYWKRRPRLQAEMVAELRSVKNDLEVKGAIRESLGMTEWSSTISTDVEVELLEAYYGEDNLSEAESALLDRIDWNKVGKEFDAWREVEGLIDEAWAKWLERYGDEARKLLEKEKEEVDEPIVA